MESAKRFFKNVVIYIHSFLIEKIENGQYLIPIYFNRSLVFLPFHRQTLPISFSFDTADIQQQNIIKSNLGLKYGFKKPVKVTIEVFEENDIVKKEYLI